MTGSSNTGRKLITGRSIWVRARSAALGLVASALCGCASTPRFAPSRDALSAQERWTLGESYARQHLSEQAAREYRAALRQDPNHLPSLLGLGNIAYAAGNFKEAKRSFARVLKREPSNAGAQNNLAMVDLALGQVKDAEALARRATASPPLRPFAYETLAQAYQRQGKNAEARTALQAAWDAAPPENLPLRQALREALQKLAQQDGHPEENKKR